MAHDPIADDFTIDAPNRRIAHNQAFVDGVPPNKYRVREFYSFLQNWADEPGNMIYPTPISAQTPLQFTMINGWFVDDESTKTLFGGSLTTSAWLKSGAEGITQLRWTTGSTDPPVTADIGKVLTGGTSGATGVLLAFDTARRVAFVRNTSATQFGNTDTVTGTLISFIVETSFSIATGESTWGNAFSLGTVQADTEIVVAQEDDFMGGNGQGGPGTIAELVSITPWWDSDVDFTASENPVPAGHVDLLVKVREAGALVDGGRLNLYGRQNESVLDHFPFTLTGGQGTFPLAATAFDGNDSEGFRRITTGVHTGTFVVGEIVTGGSSGGKVRIKAISVDTHLDYVILGKNLTDLANAEVLTGEDSAATATSSGAPGDIALGPAVAQGITVAFGHVTADIDEDGNLENYGCQVDCNSIALKEVHQRLQYLVRPGSGDQGVNWLPDADGGNEDGEFYRSVGDIYAPIDAEALSGVAENTYVTGSISGATGVVVAQNFGAGVDYLILTQVKGTFVDNDVIDLVTSPVGNTNTLNGAPSTILPLKGSPFEGFAGGNLSGARGILFINVPVAELNNYSTTSNEGTLRTPPSTVIIEFNSVVVGDVLIVAEVATGGSTDIVKNQNGVGAGGALAGATVIPLDAAVGTDVPASETMWVVDVSANDEYRLRVASISPTPDATLQDNAAMAGTATSTDGTDPIHTLVDTGAFTTMGTDTTPNVGDIIRNLLDGSWARIVRKIDNNSIETTDLVGGTSNDWQNLDTWECNVPPVALVDADTIYFPYMDRIAAATTEQSSVKFDVSTTVVGRRRFSGVSPTLPQEILGQSLGSGGLTLSGIRTPDTVKQ